MTKLKLSDIKLTEIDFKIFSKLTKLNNLNQNSNKFKSLTDKNQTLTSLQSLELIDLNCNKLALFNLNILKDLMQPKTLILRNNCKENLDKSVFSGMY